MEAAALFTVAALRGVEAGCLLTVSDIVVEGVFTRITDDELRAAVDRMTRIALDVAIVRRSLSAWPGTVFLVNPASGNGAHRASAGRSSRTAPRSSGCRTRRSSPSGRAT